MDNHQTDAHWTTLFDHLPVGAIVFSETGELLYINPEARAITSQSVQLTSASSASASTSTSTSTSSLAHLTLAHLAESAGEHPGDLLDALGADNGEPVSLALPGLEIHLAWQPARNVVAYLLPQPDEQQDQLSRLIHKINNKLTIIAGNCELIRSFTSEPATSGCVEEIQKAADEMIAAVADIGH